MISLKNISKAYKKNLALSNFSYDFIENTGYGILGINGAGKSTLIGCITKNLSYLGEIEYQNLNMHEIGYVPQELAIYPDLSVLDNLLFFAAIYKIPKQDAIKRANQLMDRVKLIDKKDELAKNLSGGMKRKLNLITGLIHSPKLLICDEVCVGIDPISRKEILEYLKELLDSGLMILYTSHYLDEVEFLCKKVLFLNEGRLILEGDTAQLVKTIGEKVDSNLSDLFIKVLRKVGE
ncbi:MAG: ABC transporter ATP-binding protein [Tissierellia bacterium]|nr:ABC transporter ATP-binding protein [Tissierellia bacterium]